MLGLLVLEHKQFRIVGVMQGDACPALDFLTNVSANHSSSRDGVLEMLAHVAEKGFQGVPAGWAKEANKQHHIMEFKKGDLRLFFFHGRNGDIAVCTCGAVKKGQKADKASVNLSAKMKQQYDDTPDEQLIYKE